MSLKPQLCAGVFVACAWATTLSAQSSLSGTVRADSGGTPLAGVEVVLEGTSQITTTDQSGRYLLSGLPPGTQVILFRLLGYRPERASVRLVADDTARYDPRLVKQSTQTLDSLEVVGRPAGSLGLGRQAFEERRARGFGRFIDTEELRRSEHRSVSDLFRGLQGVTIVRFQDCPTSTGSRQNPGACGGRTQERAASGRGERTIMRRDRDEYCWMSVMLDGHWLYQSGSNMDPPDLGRDVRVADLDLVEVYRSAAEVPGQFSGPVSGCGVILLWTNRGR